MRKKEKTNYIGIAKSMMNDFRVIQWVIAKRDFLHHAN